jgi:tetratricopeptide (TPR) repeat protein
MHQYQHELARTHNNLGHLFDLQDKLQESLAEFQRAQAVRQPLVTENPDVPEYLSEMARTYVNIGSIQRQLKNHDAALKSVEMAFPLLDAARKRDPDAIVARKILGSGHKERARILERLHRYRQAVADWDQAIRLATDPADRSSSRVERAVALARAGEYRRAMTEADDLARDESLADGNLYDLACAVALSAAGLWRDGSRPLPEPHKQAESWTGTAVGLLRRAEGLGYFRDRSKRAQLDKDADLAFLWGRDDFRAFVASLPAAKP